MKKVLSLFLIIVLNFMFIKFVNAKTVCYYGDYTLDFNDNGEFDGVYKDGKNLEDDYWIQEDITTSNVEDYKDCPEAIYYIYSSEAGSSFFQISDYSSGTGNMNRETLDPFKPRKGSKVSCGNVTRIPPKIPQLTSEFVTIIQILIPVILVIVGSIDLIKGVASQKEDEIKKGQQILIKRLITAAIIFFVVILVKFVISLVANNSSTNIVECIDCFVSNNCELTEW